MTENIVESETKTLENPKDDGELSASISKSEFGIKSRRTYSSGGGADYGFKESLGEGAPEIHNLVFTCPVDHEGTSVHVKGWVRYHSDKPPIVIVHGLGENVGMYRDAAKILGEAGYSIFVFDLRGHGRSGRQMGHIPNFDSLVSDLLQVVSWIKFKSRRRNPILIGQGLGSLVITYFQSVYPDYCQALVMTSPYVQKTYRFSKKVMIWLLAELSPTTRLPISLIPRFLCPPATLLRKANGTSVLKHNFAITSNLAREVLNALDSVEDHFARLSCPALVVCPNKENIYTNFFQMIERHTQKELFEVREVDVTNSRILTSELDEVRSTLSVITAWLDAIFVKPEIRARSEASPVGPMARVTEQEFT